VRVEPIDQRILGAINFVDATTGLQIIEALTVTAPDVRLLRNRSGSYVIASAAGLEAHVDAFEQPPAAPPVGSVPMTLQVTDPLRRYLPRRCVIQLPRDPDPTHSGQTHSLFTPTEVRLFPAPTAPTGSRWAVIRAAVTATGSPRRLAGALMRVVRVSDSTVLARGLSDARGEALIAVEGIPVTTWDEGTGPVITQEVEVILHTIYDPQTTGLPDPDDLEVRRDSLPSSEVHVRLASGRVLVTALSVALP
jgi:hypothetical protein